MNPEFWSQPWVKNPWWWNWEKVGNSWCSPFVIDLVMTAPIKPPLLQLSMAQWRSEIRIEVHLTLQCFPRWGCWPRSSWSSTFLGGQSLKWLFLMVRLAPFGQGFLRIIPYLKECVGVVYRISILLIKSQYSHLLCGLHHHIIPILPRPRTLQHPGIWKSSHNPNRLKPPTTILLLI